MIHPLLQHDSSLITELDVDCHLLSIVRAAKIRTFGDGMPMLLCICFTNSTSASVVSKDAAHATILDDAGQSNMCLAFDGQMSLSHMPLHSGVELKKKNFDVVKK